MALKLILSICVLMHLIGHVASVNVEDDCMWYVRSYPEEAKDFAEVAATQEEMKVAIDSIAKQYLDSWNIKKEQYRAKVKASVISKLTQCFEIRKVKYF